MPRMLHHRHLSELYIAKAIVNIMQVQEYFPFPIYTTYVKSVHEAHHPLYISTKATAITTLVQVH